ncbi:phage tail protein [Curvivirga sp.]|uniref:phage tail protein n=1 Tax=Curvivirga sp. TaxID=2856848 RepID=UPI003B599C4F
MTNTSISPPLGNPIGTVIWHAADTAPSGFLECNGDAVSRTTYSALFDVIGETFGNGDGSTTFNLPDLRGEFIRGWDNGRAIDNNRTFGSFQADEFKSHTHKYGSINGSGTSWPFGSNYRYDDDLDTSAAGGSETRPRNVALLPCIKYSEWVLVQ